MKPAKDGSKLWKRLEVKIIVGEKVMPHVFRAPPKRGYSAADIEASLERVIEHLDAKFPTLEFKQVELGPNKFNFIAIGARQGETNHVSERGEQGSISSGGSGSDGERARPNAEETARRSTDGSDSKASVSN